MQEQPLVPRLQQRIVPALPIIVAAVPVRRIMHLLAAHLIMALLLVAVIMAVRQPAAVTADIAAAEALAVVVMAEDTAVAEVHAPLVVEVLPADKSYFKNEEVAPKQPLFLFFAKRLFIVEFLTYARACGYVWMTAWFGC